MYTFIKDALTYFVYLYLFLEIMADLLMYFKCKYTK